ncbi:MAG: hypothetical protein ACLQFI_20580 [Methylocella sp.]
MISYGLTVLCNSATGINNKRKVVGLYEDSNGADHGFLYNGH